MIETSVVNEKQEYDIFREYLRDLAGISLSANKEYLVKTRMRRVLLDYGLSSLAELNKALKKVPCDRMLRQSVIDAMTTNETFWFRDLYPYEYLRNTILPELNAEKKAPTKLRIWSAACSSGQEPYSISIVIEEFMRATLGLKSFNYEITATDISSQILERAREAKYDKLSISRGMANDRLRNFFDLKQDDMWHLKDHIKKNVSFQSINLQDSFAALGRFDLVFCRNVLIYFSADLKTDILKRIHAAMRPGGLLFLGASESMSSVSEYFEMVHCNPGVAYRAK